jgi:Protein of unknown function (DUF2934)
MKQSHHASGHEAQSKSKSHAKSGPATAESARHDGDMEVQIREAAYYRYLARGAEFGHDLDDWLQAESQFIEIEKSRDVSH